jgi:hypothetical protein
MDTDSTKGQGMGVPASPSGLQGFAPEPAAQSQPEALVPNPEYATFVFRCAGPKVALEFRKAIFEKYPFDSSLPVSMVACATGDAMSVSEAMRMALECRALDSYEQRDLALELAEQSDWHYCLKHAEAEWSLVVSETGEFVSASAIETEGQDREAGLGAEHESAVAEGPTPQTSPDTPTQDNTGASHD